MDCKQAVEVLFLFFDDELEAELKQPFQDHVAHCPGCNHRLDYTRKLLILVRQRCIRQQAPPRLRHRILTSLPHRRNWT